MTGKSTADRSRQPALFRLENPLTQRFGPDYFIGLPKGPGVYFFSDREARLLYIGQSANLRARIGSYRHVTPDRHPRRTLRLVARIHRIVWEACASPAEAIAREKALLLEHRPPFNRAGVWIGDPWWLTVEVGSRNLVLSLGREQTGIGPLPPSFRHVFGSLARCVYRAALPEQALHAYPHGLMKPAVPLSLLLPLPDSEKSHRIFTECANGRVDELLAQFDALPLPSSTQQQEFWLAERERLVTYGGKINSLVGIGMVEGLDHGLIGS